MEQIKKRSRNWTDTDTEKVKNMIMDGKSKEEIIAHFGLKENGGFAENRH